MKGIANTVRNYYQKSYPQVYAAQQQAVQAAVVSLQDTYSRYFFPSMKVRWDTYPVNQGHLYFVGCFRCHDGRHKSVDGTAIRSDCDTCHKILQQGQARNLQFATAPKGLIFKHPVDIGGAWAQTPCNSCHTGGPM